MNARQAKKYNDYQHREYVFGVIRDTVAESLQANIAKEDWARVASIIQRAKNVLKGIRTQRGLRAGVFPITRFAEFIQGAAHYEVVKNG